MNPGSPSEVGEEFSFEEVPDAGINRLFSTLGKDGDPGTLEEIGAVPAPAFGSLADPADSNLPGQSIWTRTDVEGQAVPARPSEPVHAPEPAVRERLHRLRSEEVPEPEGFAGIELAPVPRNPVSRIWGKATGNPMADAPSDMDPPSEFEKLLRPLSGPELTLLRRDTQSDETIFASIEKVRSDAYIRQWLGLLVGVMAVAVFLLAAGQDYVLETLPSARIPGFVPDGESVRSIASGVLFSIGLILPLLCVFVFAEATRLALAAIGERSAWLVAAAALPAAAGVLAMSYLISGRVLAALVLLALYAVLASIERTARPGRDT